MTANYRHIARAHLECAEKELSLYEDLRLRHAALELRMAMEALTYDRALSFKDEFPPSEYETWQPRKIMLVLLEIDSNADQDSSLSYGVEKEFGVPAAEMKSLGTEAVLNMSVLKEHYDALGSYLHVQSLKHHKDGKALNFTKFRRRCEEIRALINKVLSSKVYNITLGLFSTFECDQCKKPIRKRIPQGKDKVEAKCFNCEAAYTLIAIGDGIFRWDPQQVEIECANPKCAEKIVIWQHELQVGKYWNCSGCDAKNSIVMGVTYND